MKQVILLTAFIASVHLCPGRLAAINNGNNFQQSVYKETALITLPQMQQMLSEIMNAVGLQNDFELREANVLNLEATISHRKRYISYNPEFINRVNAVAKDKWAVMTLLAHEVAHHLEGHTVRKCGSKPTLELEADEFAGSPSRTCRRWCSGTVPGGNEIHCCYKNVKDSSGTSFTYAGY